MIEVEERARDDRDAHARTGKLQEACNAACASAADQSIDERADEAEVDTENRRLRDAQEGRNRRGEVKRALLGILRLHGNGQPRRPVPR